MARRARASARVRRRSKTQWSTLGSLPLSIGSSKASLGYEVGISQKLPWFGKRSLEASAAAAEAEASKNDFEAMRRELALTAVSLYDQYFVAVRSLEINREHVELMRVMRGGATAQFESGRGSAQDPLQAESELAHMEHDTAILSSEREILVAQMNELLHRDPSDPLPPPRRNSRCLLCPTFAIRSAWRRKPSQSVRTSLRSDSAHAPSSRARTGQAANITPTSPSPLRTIRCGTRRGASLDGGASGSICAIQTGARPERQRQTRQRRCAPSSRAMPSRLEASARTQVFVSLKQLEESHHVLRLFEERLLSHGRAGRNRRGTRRLHDLAQSVHGRDRSRRRTLRHRRSSTTRWRAPIATAATRSSNARLGRIPGLDGKGRADDR